VWDSIILKTENSNFADLESILGKRSSCNLSCQKTLLTPELLPVRYYILLLSTVRSVCTCFSRLGVYLNRCPKLC
jgi:hypothetical protein